MFCYPITKWDIFEFIILNLFIIHVVFALANTLEYLYIDTTQTQTATPSNPNPTKKGNLTWISNSPEQHQRDNNISQRVLVLAEVYSFFKFMVEVPSISQG